MDRTSVSSPFSISFLASAVVSGRAGAIFLAIASPLDAFGGLLLQVHMVQHLLLMMVAPPLILAGAPYLPLLSGLPRVVAREVVGPFLIWLPLKRIGRFLFNPVVCWIAFATSNVLWHLPVFYELALSSPGWHQVEHLCFLGTGLLFWWHIILPWPSSCSLAALGDDSIPGPR